MKKYQFMILSLVLMVLAVLTGGASCMAMAAAATDGSDGGVNGADASANDMNAPGVNGEGEQNKAGQDLTSTAASREQMRDGGLLLEETDKEIAKFRPFRFPLDTDIRTMAKQVKVKDMIVTTWQSGSANLDFELLSAVEEGASEIKLSKDTVNLTTKTNPFTKYSTICVQGVSGYKPGSTSQNKGTLQLFVTDVTANVATAIPINGKAETEGGKDMVLPAIPAGTKLSILANACSETQMQVAPENYQPRDVHYYLQKKIMNIVVSNKLDEDSKKIPFSLDDIKADGMYNFRRKCSRTNWIGSMGKMTVYTGEQMGEEVIYFQEGVMPQLTMAMGVPSEMDRKTMTAVSKLMFTDNAQGNMAVAYCGKNYIEKILNIKDVTVYKELGFQKVQKDGMEIHEYSDNFGTIDYKYDPSLDDLGFQDFAVVIDIKHAKRYINDNMKQYTVDMTNGAGENREATRNVTIMIDCLALRGYNSILLGPSDKIEGQTIADAATTVTMATTVPANPSDGELIFLTQADTTLGLEANKAYKYSASSGKWTVFKGTVTTNG
jgi:hypothetical protein